jgi:anti-anti-sigma regulatory factor
MPTIAGWFKVDGERMVESLQETAAQLDASETEVVLDFSCVRRVNPGALRAMEELATVADAKAVKIGLRGVNVTIYKVLKLAKLAPRFSFVN